MRVAARRSPDGCRERRLTHRLPFPDRRPTRAEDSTRHVRRYPCPTPSSVASCFPPRSSRSSRWPRSRSRPARAQGEDLRREGRGRLVRRRPGRRGLPDPLLPGRDPVAARRREGLLERGGGHPAGARVRAAARAGSGPTGGPAPTGTGSQPAEPPTTTAPPPSDGTDTSGVPPVTTNGPGSDTVAAPPGVDTSGPSSVPIPLLILGASRCCSLPRAAPAT